MKDDWGKDDKSVSGDIDWGLDDEVALGDPKRPVEARGLGGELVPSMPGEAPVPSMSNPDAEEARDPIAGGTVPWAASDDGRGVTTRPREAQGGPVAPDPVDFTGIDQNPEGTAAGRAVRRGALRTASSLPQALATADAQALADSNLDDRSISESVFLEVTGLPSVPSGLDLSTPEKAAAEISKLGYPASYPNIFRGTFEQRRLNAAEARANPEKFSERGAKNLQSAEGFAKRAEKLPMSPQGEEMKRILAATPDTFGEAFMAIARNPERFAYFIAETATESAPQMAAAAATTLVTRSPTAGALALGGGTVSQEYGSSAREFLQENKIKLESEADAISLLNNPQIMKLASERGITRGLVIAAFEIVGQGAAAKSFLKTPIGNAIVDSTVQGLTGAGGEATARLAAGQEMSPTEILIEGMAELATAPIEVAIAGKNSLTKGRGDSGTDSTPTPPQQDTQRLNSPRLTEGDRASPIRNDVIDDGKAILEDLLNPDGPQRTPPVQPDIPAGAVPVSDLYGDVEEESPAAPVKPEVNAETPAPTDLPATDPVLQETDPVQAESEPVLQESPANPVSTPGIEVLDNDGIQSIQTDAKTFQYKSNTDEDGVSDRLRGVKKWDSNRTGVALVYEYADGRRVVADGHQRVGLAKRLAAEGQAIDLPIRVLREADGVSESDARKIAAEKNIAEGTGTALDAAKVLRESGKSAAELNLPTNSALVRNGDSMRNLSDDAFGMVLNSVANERDAAMVGSLVKDKARHTDILGLLTRLKPANAMQAESIVRQALDTEVTETQTSLFGEEEVSANLYLERAKVLDRAMKDLRLNEQTFKVLLERGDTITEAGNVLDQDTNEAQKDDAAKARAVLMKEANTKGPISDALTQAAREVKDGAKPGAAARKFLIAIREGQGLAQGNGAEPGGPGPRTERAGESGPAENTQADQEAGIDKTDAGDQIRMPGFEPAPVRAPRDRDEPEQDETLPEGGLFDDNATQQTDIADFTQDTGGKDRPKPTAEKDDGPKTLDQVLKNDGGQRAFDNLKEAWEARENLPDSDTEGFVAQTKDVTAARDAFEIIAGKDLANAALEKIEGEYKPVNSDVNNSSPETEKPAKAPDNKKKPLSSLSQQKQDRAALLRARIAERMKNQINAGLDPEMLKDALELVALYIEDGARKFRALVDQVAGDMGLTTGEIEPWVRAAYNQARDDMDLNGDDVADMDSAADVLKEVKAMRAEAKDPKAEDKKPEPKPAPPAPKPAPEKAGGDDADTRTRLIEGFRTAFAGGESFDTIIQARKKVEEYTGQPYSPDMAKDLEEAIEVAVVLRAREMIKEGGGKQDLELFQDMVSLYQSQPKLAQRTSTSIEMQAYSTPAPLAYLASRLAKVGPNKTIYEPTAGNGMLLMEANPAKVTAGEMQESRVDGLKRVLGDKAKILTGDAMEANPGAYSLLIANPPFGKVRDDVGKVKVFDLVGMDGTTSEIDHAIVAKGLDGLSDPGMAVLIIGGQKGNDPEARRKEYTKGERRKFFKKLYDTYGVTEHFTVDGRLYERQGAGWPVDVIVIAGKGATSKPYPMKEAPVLYSSWEALGERLDGKNTLDPRRGDDGRRDGDNGEADQASDNERVPSGPVPNDRPNGDAGGTGGSPTPSQADGGGRGGSGSNSQSGGSGGRSGIRVGTPGGTVGNVDPDMADSTGADQARDRADDSRNDGAPADRVSRDSVSRERIERDNQEAETSFQVQYQPRSNATFAVGTLVPKNMQQAMSRALDDRERRVGDIDNYLAKKLGYTVDEMLGIAEVIPSDKAKMLREARQAAADLVAAKASLARARSRGDTRRAEARVRAAQKRVSQSRLDFKAADFQGVEGVPGYFSAEQMDALALAIDNVEQGKGFIIGDQTGVGKGRFVAAMLRYADLNGRTPVFVSKDPGLYADMVRDMRDIGMKSANKQVFVTNQDLRSKKALPLSDKDGDVLSSVTPKQMREALSEMMRTGKLPKGFKYLFTTYSQMQQVKGEDTPRMAMLRSIAPEAMFVLDESHEAGGVSSETRADQDKMPRSEFIRALLAEARSAVFSSATYAKNPAVMSLYGKTDLSLSVDKLSDLEGTVAAGGVPLQQVMANMLVEAGQYARRERSYVGVEMGMKQLVTDKAMATRGAEVLRTLFRLDVEVMQDVRDAYIKEAEGEGMAGVADGAVGGSGMSSTNFASTMHNLAAQFLLAIKVKAVIADAIELHKEGKKVIIALSNTNATIIKEAADESGVRNGQGLDVPFNKILERYLARLRRITVKDENDKKSYIFLTDDDIIRNGGYQALDAFKEAEDFIKSSDLSGLPGSPIDAILDGLDEAGINPGEITGRTVTLRNNILETRDASAAVKKGVMNAFNRGDLDALVINRSGSTGFSMHATDKPGNDGKKRHMIILQPEPNIDVFMQMLGRIHRTGQIELPGYTIAVSDLAVEKRPAAVLMRKMASLNANTTANKKSAVSLDNVVDFLNPYGDAVVAAYLRENVSLQIAIDLAVGKEIDGIAAKFTGRLVSLPPDQVTEIYEQVEAQYLDYIDALDRMGMNALEAKTLELDAKTVNEVEVVPAKDESSPFGRAAYVQTVDVKRLGKPYSPEQLDKELESVTKGENPYAFAKSQGETLKSMISEANVSIDRRLAIAQQKLEEAKTDKQKDGAQDAINRALTDKAEVTAKAYSVVDQIEEMAPGRVGTITVNEGESSQSFAAMSLGADISRVKNPAAAGQITLRIAFADAGRELRVPLSQLMGADSKYTWQGMPDRNRGAVIQAFKDGQSESREQRQMVTGNIPAGFSQFKRGQIVMYTDDSGMLRQGVLLPKSFDAGGALRDRPVVMTPDQVAEYLMDGDFGKRIAQSEDGNMSISYNGDRFAILVKTQGHKKYTMNRAVRDILGDWEARTGAKVFRKGTDDQNTLKRVLQIYSDNLGTEYSTTIDREVARRITGEVVPDIIDPNAKDPRQSRFAMSRAERQMRDQLDPASTEIVNAGEVITETTPKAREKAGQIVKDMNRELAKVGLPGVEVKVAERAFGLMPDGEYLQIDGSYFNNLIVMSMQNNRGMTDTVRHEAIHALRDPTLWVRDFGLFRRAEWAALEKAAIESSEYMAEAERLYPGFDKEAQIEEAIADMYADWAAGRFEAKGFLASAMQRIERALEAISNALRGNGFTTAESVFKKVGRGEVGARQSEGRGRIEPTLTARTKYARSASAPDAEQRLTNNQVSEFVGEPVTGAVRHDTPIQKRQDTFLKTAMTQPLDAAFRIPFMMVGGLDQYGRWKYGKAAEAKLKNLVVDQSFGFMNPLMDAVRGGLIDRYGAPEGFVERDRRRGVDEALIAAEGAEHVKALLDREMSTQEAKVLQAVLTGEAVAEADMAKLAAPIRQAIDGLGSEAVALGLISRESYERNRGTYLHRVYEKNEFESSNVLKWAGAIASGRRRRIIGNQFKGRGLFEDVDGEKILRDNEEFLSAKRGKPQKGDKLIMLELRTTTGTEALNEMESPKGRVKRRVWWPADKPIPAKLNNYVNRGTFEVRGENGKKITMWRDFTKEERTKMGEILDARYTIAKTYSVMSKDLATGRFFKDIAENEEWSRKTPPEGARLEDAPRERNFAGQFALRSGIIKADWVRVPNTKITKSGTYVYGALAGRYVRAEIWRDMEETRIMSQPSFWNSLLTFWKLNKTARNPVVHMNNIMSNFMFADMADVRAPDIVKGIMSMANKDMAYQEAATAGAFGADMVSQELRDTVMKPLMEELVREMNGRKGSLEADLGSIGKVLDVLGRGVKYADGKMIDFYQLEDQVFRMATYIRRREQGMGIEEAAIEARDQFLNYDIRAPWINAARRTVLPFMSYTYRAVPKLAQTMAERPWKVAKYIAIYQSLNMLSYALAPSEWDEEEERKSLRKEEQGNIGFLGVPFSERLVRMPYLSDGNPVFLDVRRWVPAGDVFDMQGGDLPASITPGGPLVIAAELLLNKQSFTDQEIVNKITDERGERMAKRADFAWKALMPAAPWVPGSWYYEKIKRAVYDDALQWGSNEPYDPMEAILSSAGIKLKPKDVELGYMSWQLEYDRQERELAFQLSSLKRQAARRMVSEKAFEREFDRIMEKKQKLREEKADRFPK